MNQNLKILILEDDTLFAESLEDFLVESGFLVELCEDGQSALDKSYENNYDLLLFDINTPKLNGYEVLQNIREQNDNTPAIFLTSFKDKDSIIKGFNKGADDYLKKPVDLDELYMRITALLKRSNLLFDAIKIRDHIYYPDEKKLHLGDKEQLLSKKQSKLLELFIQNKNQLVTKEMIYNKLWKWDKEPSEGSIRVYITQLKKLLGKDIIQNHKGLGYKLEL